MIALFDFVPSFCPQCGRELTFSVLAMADYLAHCSFACACGLSYQLAETRDLYAAATAAGGDLEKAAQYQE